MSGSTRAKAMDDARRHHEIPSPPLVPDGRPELIAQAEERVDAMGSRSPDAIADLAHFLWLCARRQKLTAIADAAAQVEHAAQMPGTKVLAAPMRRLSAAVADAQASMQT